MDLGEKLIKLRKAKQMTQEEVSEKLKVTRQTISNWELNQTKPDIDQIKNISKLYHISIDDLIDNDIKAILTEKISNVEKLTGLVYKVLKGLIILLGIFIVFIVIWKIFTHSTYAWFVGATHEYECQLNDKTYHIIVETESEQYDCANTATCFREGDVNNVYVNPYISILNLEKGSKVYQVKNIIFNYFEEKNGTCTDYLNYDNQ